MFKYAEGLHTLTDRLLYIQKAEAGMVKLRLSAVDVLSLMRDVAEGFQPLAAERRITYEWVQGRSILRYGPTGRNFHQSFRT